MADSIWNPNDLPLALVQIQPYLCSLLRQRLLRQSQTFDQEDLIQETNQLALSHLQSFAGNSLAEFRGWLRRILFNLTIDKLRKPSEQIVSLERLSETVISPFSSPTEILIHQELCLKMHSCLSQLSESDLAFILIHFYEGKSLQQIAECNNTTPNSIRKRKSRIIWRLRICLTEQDSNQLNERDFFSFRLLD